jgi:hypothetical protein
VHELQEMEELDCGGCEVSTQGQPGGKYERCGQQLPFVHHRCYLGAATLARDISKSSKAFVKIGPVVDERHGTDHSTQHSSS